MPDRNPHSDNALIDEMTEFETPPQQSSSGGVVNRDVGTRSEEERVTDPASRERPTGSDNPAEDEKKGPKTREALKQQGRVPD